MNRPLLRSRAGTQARPYITVLCGALLMDWEPVIGLEVHAQLLTRSKRVPDANVNLWKPASLLFCRTLCRNTMKPKTQGPHHLEHGGELRIPLGR